MTATEGNSGTMIVSSVSREQVESLPPLIVDARQNSLASAEYFLGTIYIKPVAMPYVENHVLVVPDRMDGKDMPGIVDLPGDLLKRSLTVARDVASFYESQDGVEAIDVGFNYSPSENRKVIASQRKNLHIHVEGFTRADLDHRISDSEVRDRPEFKVQTSEPAQPIINDLMQMVFQEVDEQDPYFAELFERVSDDSQGRITFRLKEGLDTLANGGFSSVIKDMHEIASYYYRDLAKRFVKTDPDSGEFIESEDGRYELLDRDERIEAVNEYIRFYGKRLSDKSKIMLRYYAGAIRSISEMSGGNEDFDFQRFAVIKDFAYACSVSGVKTDNGWEYRFGFDPVVRSKRDSTQASRGEFKLFERDSSKAYDEETLARVKEREAQLAKYLEERATVLLPYRKR